jgi:hypothetical protein
MWQPFAAPLDFAMRAPNAALWGLGAAAGEAYKRASGDEAGGNRLTRDLIQGGQALLLKSAAAYPQVAAGRVASPKQVIGREEVAVRPAMAGGLGPIKESGPVRTPTLPMDEASRMRRATEMGFDVNTPVYHGSAAEFREFDPGRLGETTRAPSARLGVWSAAEPELANRFAMQAAQSRDGKPRGFPQVYPLFARSENQGVLRMTGRESDLDVAGALMNAFDQGIDSVWLRYPSSVGGPNKDVLVVKNPNQYRSRFAVFDPNKRESSDLLANVAGVSLGGGTLYGLAPSTSHSHND